MTGLKRIPSPWVGAAAVAAGVLSIVATPAAQGKRAELDGVWILAGRAQIDMVLTPAGEAARASYDYLTDDPCHAVHPGHIHTGDAHAVAAY